MSGVAFEVSSSDVLVKRIGAKRIRLTPTETQITEQKLVVRANDGVDVKNEGDGLVFTNESSSQYVRGRVGQYVTFLDQIGGSTGNAWAYGNLPIDSTTASTLGSSITWKVIILHLPETANPGVGVKIGLIDEDIIATQDPDAVLDDSDSILYQGDGTLFKDGVSNQVGVQDLAIEIGDGLISIEMVFDTSGNIQFKFLQNPPPPTHTNVGTAIALTPGTTYRLVVGSESTIGETMVFFAARPADKKTSLGLGIGGPGAGSVSCSVPVFTTILNTSVFFWKQPHVWATIRGNTTVTPLSGVAAGVWLRIYCDASLFTCHEGFSFKCAQDSANNSPTAQYLGSGGSTFFNLSVSYFISQTSNGTRLYDIAFALESAGSPDIRTINSLLLRGQTVNSGSVQAVGMIQSGIRQRVAFYIRNPVGETPTDILVASLTLRATSLPLTAQNP